MATILVKRGQASSIGQASLVSGEFYLETDTNTLKIKNGDTIIEIANSSTVTQLSQQLSSLVETVNTITGNIVNLNGDIQDLQNNINNHIENKNNPHEVTIEQVGGIKQPQTAVDGQVLVYSQSQQAWVAGDVSSGSASIILSSQQPGDGVQEENSLWLKDLTAS